MKKPTAFYLPIVPVLLLFSGCYTLKQGTTLLGYLGKAIPLEKLAEQKADDEDIKNFVERVEIIRRFAMEELGLKASKNYTRYVELNRDYLAAVVSACAEDSFTRHEWHFPVVGDLPYKGFFDPADAKKEAAKLKSENLDVWIRGVDAFSTLGWFKDPLYSYMKDYSEYQLAELIIHELLHATVFIKGKAEFNEQLAEYVGNQGARLYIENRFGIDSREFQSIDSGTADYRAYKEFLAELCAELETIYARQDLNREQKLTEKERIIKAAKERFDAEYDNRFQGENYRGFSKIAVNNAYLDLYRLYQEEDNFFANLTKTIPGVGITKLRTVIEAAASLNKSREARKDPRGTLTKTLSAIHI